MKVGTGVEMKGQTEDLLEKSRIGDVFSGRVSGEVKMKL